MDRYLIRNLVRALPRKLGFRAVGAAIYRLLLGCVERENLLNLSRGLRAVGGNMNIDTPWTFKNPKYISIGNDFSAMARLRIEAIDEFEGVRFAPSITIGHQVRMNTDVHIGCIDRVTIGDRVLLASRIYISDHSHGSVCAADMDLPPARRKLASRGGVTIEEDVWIGEGACIFPGVTIGRGAIIGANAVVTKSVPARAVAAGIPAKVLRVLQ